jgi:long-subunit fatty acid transport protein
LARLLFQSKINNNILPFLHRPDDGFALESWDEAFGGNVSILLRPIAEVRIGLTYQSPVDYKFRFRPHLTGLRPLLSRLRTRIGGTKINLPMEVPQQVMLSGLYDVTSYWNQMGHVGWQN